MGKQTRKTVVKGAAAVGDRAAPDDEGARAAPLGFLPADPEDLLLTLDGAKCKEDGKIDVAAYAELAKAYASEPPPDQHPDPTRPGVRQGEYVPKGLRMWDDVAAGCTGKDGAGWIAAYTARNRGRTEKWFNIRTCGSWRLAFVLARLQRDLWERSAPRAPTPSDAAAAAEGAEVAAAEGRTAGASPGREGPATATPQSKRKRPQELGEASARKRPTASRRQPPSAGAPQRDPAPAPGPIVPASGSKLSSVMERLKAKLAAKAAEQPDGGEAALDGSAAAAAPEQPTAAA